MPTKEVTHQKGHVAVIGPIDSKMMSQATLEVFKETGVNLDFGSPDAPNTTLTGKGLWSTKLAKRACSEFSRMVDGSLVKLPKADREELIEKHGTLASWIVSKGMEFNKELGADLEEEVPNS